MLNFLTKKDKTADNPLIILIFILLILGILILANASAFISQQKFGDSYYFLKHQIFPGLILGLILGFFAFKIKLDFLKKWSMPLLLLNLFFLCMVFVPKIGRISGGAARWISLGPLSFQPSEFLKLTFIIYLAAWLANRQLKIKKNNQTFIVFLAIIAIISLLFILQPDISTLGIILTSGGLMYFLANTPIWHSILMLLVGGGGLITLIKFEPYRLNRLLVFLNPEIEPMGIGYQIKQILITVGSGGLFGLGLGLSKQKYGFLPQPMSDSIFAIFAEETGFAGSTFLILIFLAVLWRGFKIAKMQKDTFYQLTAIGITCWICLQSFINIAAMIRILPLTGIPLPFISYGGSALISQLMGIGILLNISKS